MKCMSKTRTGATCVQPGFPAVGGWVGCHNHPGPERVDPPVPARIQPGELVPVPISVDELFAAMGRAGSAL